MTVRALLKETLESVLVVGGVARFGQRRRRDRALVLAYHNVLPDGSLPAGERSLHLPFPAFRRQLDILEASCDIVPLAEAVGPPSETRTRPRVAITFDDAYRGAVETALPELARRGLPATLFVAPGCLGNQGFWWDRLRLAGGAALSESARLLALTRGRGIQDEILRLTREEGFGWVAVPDPWHAVTESELAEAATAPRLTLAPHSWSHANLAVLTAEELVPETREPLSWLRNRFPQVEPWLAYPYGLVSPLAERAAADAGYELGFLVSGGWLPAAVAPGLDLPRLNVPAGLSPAGFELRLGGLLA